MNNATERQNPANIEQMAIAILHFVRIAVILCQLGIYVEKDQTIQNTCMSKS